MGSGTGSRSDFAFVELFGILKQLNTPFFGIAVDSRIAEAREIRKVTDLASLAKGGGGTDMRVGIQRAAELKPTPDVIVVLTDGETPWPSVEQMPRKSRLVVAVVSESSGAFDHLPEYIKRSAVFIDMKNGTGR
jgi:predicted metal-dependent peptidase